MRVFTSPLKNYGYFVYRLFLPIIDPIRFVTGLFGYIWYIRDLFLFFAKDPQAKLFGLNLFPILDEKITIHPFDAHYFYQEIWAFKHILKRKPKRHIDVASKHQFSGLVSTLCTSTYIDFRPLPIQLNNYQSQKGNILSLPFANNSVESISTLHVIEHIGLGRYGDPIDPLGTQKACIELSRVLKRKGRLYLSVPTGKYRICFNAHRVHPASMILSYFPDLYLVEFSVVDDAGIFYQNVDYRKFSHMWYGCGMYLFTKK